MATPFVRGFLRMNRIIAGGTSTTVQVIKNDSNNSMEDKSLI